MEAIKGTIPKENKGISFGRQGHASRLLGRRRHHTSWCLLPVGTNMNQEYYSYFIRSLKREMVRKRRNKLQKRTWPSPPRQCTAPSGIRHHGNNRGLRPPTSWTSFLFPWLMSLRLIYLIFYSLKEATEKLSLWRQWRYFFSSTTPLLGLFYSLKWKSNWKAVALKTVTIFFLAQPPHF